jgi:hypothetical protein
MIRNEPSLNKTASWVIVDKATGKAVLEIWNEEWLKLLKTDKYQAIPVQEYLGGLNSPLTITEPGKEYDHAHD